MRYKKNVTWEDLPKKWQRAVLDVLRARIERAEVELAYYSDADIKPTQFMSDERCTARACRAAMKKLG